MPIIAHMTKDQIEAVLDRVQSWPKARQEDAARLLLAMEAQASAPYQLSEDEHAELQTALDEIARGELATEDEVEAVFGRHRS